MTKEIISEHVFIFPFTWKYNSKNNEYLFLQHEQIKNKEFDKLKNWTSSYITIQEDKTYNEFVYFHKPVRAALYTLEHLPLIVRNYDYAALAQDNYFVIKTDGQEYRLTIQAIRLKIYKTGVAVLSIDSVNTLHEEMEAIERINSFSKCIYPPVLPLEKAREELFPDSIKIKLNPHQELEENFKKDYHKEPAGITPLILSILGEPFICKEKDEQPGSIFIEPLLGNQMFCLCLYKNKALAESVQKDTAHFDKLEELMTSSKKIMYTHGNDLPVDRGSIYYLKTEDSIYGIGRFSLFCIAKQVPQIKLYDQLITLAIMQRATLLNLSTEIARVSTLSQYDLVPAIKSIYEIYIQFINQLYFKEVTEDAQGSQIYETLSKQFKVQEELEQLDFEINEVHEYAMLIEQTQSKLKVEILTIVGASLVIPTFATGFFGMNIFKEEIMSWWKDKNIALWMNSYVFLPILGTIAVYTWNKRRTKFHLIKNIGITLVFLLSIGIIIKYGCGL